MSWMLLMTLITNTTGSDIESPEQTTQQPITSDQPAQPSIELLLFLAEWQDSDNNQWIDPEAFAPDNTMNQQLDTPKEKEDETDPDYN